MKCASALSIARNSASAFSDVVGRTAEAMGGGAPDLAVAFVSAHHADKLGDLAEMCRGEALGARHFLACTGETIVGDGREVEGATAVSLWAARLPEGSEVRPIRLEWSEDGIAGLPEGLSGGPESRVVLLLVDPFSFPPDRLFLTLESAAPGLRVVGGMASAAQAPGGNRLALGSLVFDDGAVGLVLDVASARVRTVVSQGCRPVGRPLLVTAADGNLIQALGRRPATEVLRETYHSADEADQALMRGGLHVGRVINEYQDSFGRGDFLVRNVMGASDEAGIAITELVRVGQTVQFHVRDAETADEDLRALLAKEGERPGVAGALLFSCNGRGTRLFPSPDHDVTAIRDALGPIPVSGFFAMGELGPVGGKNFVHGFTASVALFESS